MHLGTWLTTVDSAILRALYESGFELAPTGLAHNLELGATPDHVGRRLRTLTEAGLVYRVEEPRGYYGITDLGRDVVEENVSREEINELDPDPE